MIRAALEIDQPNEVLYGTDPRSESGAQSRSVPHTEVCMHWGSADGGGSLTHEREDWLD